jgi:hypothetical protein
MVNTTLTLLLISTIAWSNDQAMSQYPSQERRITQCSKNSSYLQDDLKFLSFRHVPGANTDPDHRSESLIARLLQVGTFKYPLINHDCTKNALATVTAGPPKTIKEKFRSNRFIKCVGREKNQPLDHQDAPCTSPEYEVLIQNSFELATRCIKEFVAESSDLNIQNTWVEGYFKMLSSESGLQLNVISQINAAGMGQITPIYIQDFKKSTFTDLKKYLESMNTSETCKRMGKEILTNDRIDKLLNRVTISRPGGKKVTYEALNICSNMDINDGQPLLNLIISFSHLRSLKQRIENEITENNSYQNVFKGMSKEQLIDLEIKLVSWSYNLGPWGLIQHAQKVLDQFYSNRILSKPLDFFTQDKMRGKDNYIMFLEKRYQNILQKRTTCRTDIVN